MRKAARRDSSINLHERLLTQEEEQEHNRRLNRLQRIADSLEEQLIVEKEEHRGLVAQIKQAKRNLRQSRPSQSGGAGRNPAFLEAYINFRKAFSRVQKAHIDGRNFIRRDSAVSDDLVESERIDLANEIIEADAQLEIAERNLNDLQSSTT